MITPKIFMTENTLLPRLMMMDTAVRKGVQATLLRYESIAEARMKTKAPWTDRTGNARNGLSAKAIVGDEIDSLVLFHQVPYGIWLEVKNGGQYAVIMPTVNEIGPEIMKTLNKIMAGLGSTGRFTLS